MAIRSLESFRTHCVLVTLYLKGTLFLIQRCINQFFMKI